MMDVMSKAARPKILAGKTVCIETGCGKMYVQLNWHEGKLFEVFASLGKTGGCPACLSEAITRSITLGLRYGVPLRDYIKQLENLRCPQPVLGKEHVLSCPDAISKVLKDYALEVKDDQAKEVVASVPVPDRES